MTKVNRLINLSDLFSFLLFRIHKMHNLCNPYLASGLILMLAAAVLVTVTVISAQSPLTGDLVASSIQADGDAFFNGRVYVQPPIDPMEPVPLSYLQNFWSEGTLIDLSGNVVSVVGEFVDGGVCIYEGAELNCSKTFEFFLGDSPVFRSIVLTENGTEPMNVVTKSFVESLYSAGALLVQNGYAFSVDGDFVEGRICIISGGRFDCNHTLQDLVPNVLVVDTLKITGTPSAPEDAIPLSYLQNFWSEGTLIDLNGNVVSVVGEFVDGGVCIYEGAELNCSKTFEFFLGDSPIFRSIVLTENGTAPMNVVTKSFVESLYSAGTLLVQNGYAFSVDGEFVEGRICIISSGRFDCNHTLQDLVPNVLVVDTLKITGTPSSPEDAIPLSYLQNFWSEGTLIDLSGNVVSVVGEFVDGGVCIYEGAELNCSKTFEFFLGDSPVFRSIVLTENGTEPMNVVTKSFVESLYSAGALLVQNGYAFSVDGDFVEGRICIISGGRFDCNHTLQDLIPNVLVVDTLKITGTPSAPEDAIPLSYLQNFWTEGTLIDLNGNVVSVVGVFVEGGICIIDGGVLDCNYTIQDLVPSVLSVDTIKLTGAQSAPEDAASVSYVDGRYTAGHLMDVSSGVFSVEGTFVSDGVCVYEPFGFNCSYTARGLIGDTPTFVSVNVLAIPTENDHAASKYYVDNLFHAYGLIELNGFDFSVRGLFVNGSVCMYFDEYLDCTKSVSYWLDKNLTLDYLTVNNAPTQPNHVATKEFTETYYTAGSHMVVSNGVFSVDGNFSEGKVCLSEWQSMQCTHTVQELLGPTPTFDSVTLNLPPTDDAHATRKDYTDAVALRWDGSDFYTSAVLWSSITTRPEGGGAAVAFVQVGATSIYYARMANGNIWSTAAKMPWDWDTGTSVYPILSAALTGATGTGSVTVTLRCAIFSTENLGTLTPYTSALTVNYPPAFAAYDQQLFQFSVITMTAYPANTRLQCSVQYAETFGTAPQLMWLSMDFHYQVKRVGSTTRYT